MRAACLTAPKGKSRLLGRTPRTIRLLLLYRPSVAGTAARDRSDFVRPVADARRRVRRRIHAPTISNPSILVYNVGVLGLSLPASRRRLRSSTTRRSVKDVSGATSSASGTRATRWCGTRMARYYDIWERNGAGVGEFQRRAPPRVQGAEVTRAAPTMASAGGPGPHPQSWRDPTHPAPAFL